MSELSSPFKKECLRDKVALVTGGGSGICYEITRQLLIHGCRGAVICGRREAFLEKACMILRKETGKVVKYKVCDVRKPEQCNEAVDFVRDWFGRLDVLVNGAAGNFLAPAESLSPKGFATVMAIDALGTFNMSSAAFQLLAGNPSGNSVIINISATLQYGATHWQAHASAAKAAVDSLTRSLALEWGDYKIRVVGIAPGPIADTPGTTKLAPGIGKDVVDETITKGIPLSRMGQAYEIGHAAIFLASSAYVTGDVLVVDGGEHLYKPPLVPKEAVTELSRRIEAASRSLAPHSKL